MDKVLSIFTTALVVTAIGVVVRNGGNAAKVIEATGTSFARIQKAAYGPN